MNEATRRFALVHANDDVRQLALQGCRNQEVDFSRALQQIQGRQAARRKLPTWAAREDILYPHHLSMEQCSSELAARYKAAVLCGFPAKKSLVDLTGGFGVDFAFMSPSFDEAVYVEQQEELFTIAKANFAALGLNAQAVYGDGVEYLHRLDHASVIFLDPARRDIHGARTFGIADCTPNVLPLLGELLAKTDLLMLKLSPMLDWHKAISDVGLQHVEQVHIVSVANECKELLLLLSEKGSPAPCLVCKNDDQVERFIMEPALLLSSTGNSRISSKTMLTELNVGTDLVSVRKREKLLLQQRTDTRSVPTVDGARQHSFDTDSNTLSPSDAMAVAESFFLYEPNASLMKAGVFAALARRYGVNPLAPNSHLFASRCLVEDFPGRIFQISSISSMNKQELRTKIFPLESANISVRNFPLTVAELRRKLRLNDGGSNYIFATTLTGGERVLLVCQRASGTRI